MKFVLEEMPHTTVWSLQDQRLGVRYRAAISVGNMQSWIGSGPSAPRMAGGKGCVVLLAGMIFFQIYSSLVGCRQACVSQEFQVVGYEGEAMLEGMLFTTVV